MDEFDIWSASAADTFESPWQRGGGQKRLRGAQANPVAPSAAVQPAGKKFKAVCLTASSPGLQALAEAGANRGGEKGKTEFESQGADPADVKRRLSQATCLCQGPCHKAVKYKSLLLLCQLFWGLSAMERGMLLRHEYAAGQEEDDSVAEADPSEGRLGRRTWSLCGQVVCFPIFCNLLRTGQHTVRRQIAGVPDQRCSLLGGERSPAPRSHEKSDQVDWFFYELYQSAAEPLPEDTQCIWAEFEGAPKPNQATAFESPWTAESSSNLVHSPDLSAMVRQGVAGADYDFVPELSMNPVAAITAVACTAAFGLPVRYLQHIRIMDLYWQFLSAWEEKQQLGFFSFQKPPCFKTFARRWGFWKKWLKIRKPSQHSQCQTCFELQRQMNGSSSTWGAKLQAARDLRAHYQLQYLDRSIYWSLRQLSQAGKDVLTIIIDGMDKTKFAWPRWPFDRLPKSMEKLVRPKVVFTAAIAHGWCTALFMTNEYMDHGSSLWCELICQVLEEVWKLSQKTGRRFPRHLVIVSDNTTGFAKNQHALKFLAFLTATYKFITANLFFLIVGHTHEDIDQLFAVVLWLMLRKKSWQTPQEVLQAIAAGLRERVSRRGETLLAEQLGAVRDFKIWLGRLGLTTDNCYKTRHGVEAPHCFTMKLGCLLTPEERAMLARETGTAVQPDGVYCCVKMFLHSTKLQQAPVYQMPAARWARVQTASPTGTLRRAQSEDDVKVILELSRACLDLDLIEAGEALRQLVYSRRYFLPNLTWLETFKQPDVVDLAGSITLNPYFPHLPEASWRMAAKLDP